MRLSTLLAYVVSVSASAPAAPLRRSDADTISATPSTIASASTSVPSASLLSNLTGDSHCTSSMCVSAIVNGSTVEYVLQSKSAHNGWMAMGFGSQMANAPMVIMWANSDGSVTLSQRQASGNVMPTVASSPPRVATAVPSLTNVSSSNPKFGYSIPANSDTSQTIIWAYGLTNPDDSSTSATLQQHNSYGKFTLNLANAVTSTSSLTNPATSSSGSSSSSSSSSRSLAMAHAVLLGFAFLILLPAGALLARWLRTFSPLWFKGHWIIQFYLAGPMVIAGIGLGIAAVSNSGASHFDDDHKNWGIVLLVLYLVQCGLGGIIHFVKPREKFNRVTGTPLPRRRPPQNYGHAVLGLIVIALAFYQVRSGYNVEWPSTVGSGNALDGVNVVWTIWIVILPILYAAGLAFIPKQYRQESGMQETGSGVALNAFPPRTRTENLYRTGVPGAYVDDSTASLSPGDTSRDERSTDTSGDPFADDERSSGAYGDPFADEAGRLTPSARYNGSETSSARSRSLRPSLSSGPSNASWGTGGRQGSRNGPHVGMRERSPPGARLSSGSSGTRS